ncbi:hypothetical protein SPFM7_00040 [Salmonella phage SPFM7]|nr:hypothetical protein SPFM7_00040 [Salmonella phage SPFM7]
MAGEAGFFFNKFSYDKIYRSLVDEHATGAGISGYEKFGLVIVDEKAAGNSWLTVHCNYLPEGWSVLYLVHNESLRNEVVEKFHAGRQKGVTTHTVDMSAKFHGSSCGFLPHIALSEFRTIRYGDRAVVKELSKGLIELDSDEARAVYG